MTINDRVIRSLGEKEFALLLQQQQIEDLQAKLNEFEKLASPTTSEHDGTI